MLTLPLLLLFVASGCEVVTPKFSANTAHGISRVRWDTPDFNDRIQAQQIRVRAEAAPKPGTLAGGGLDVDVLIPQDDLFDGSGSTATEVEAWNAFAFASVHPPLGRFFKLPIRVGPTIRYFRLDSAVEDTEWVTLGLQGSVSPELVLLSSQRHPEELAIFGDFTAHVGRARAETDSDRVKRSSGDRGGRAFGYELEAGVRYRYQQFEIRGSWLHQRSEIGEIDRFINTDVPALNQRFDGFTISLGIFF